MTASSRRTDSGWRVHTLLIFFGAAVALLASEIVVRLTGAAPQVGFFTARRFQLSSDPDVAYEPVPFYEDRGPFAGTDQHLAGGFRGRTNSMGFRDRERSTPKPPFRSRALVIGDSVTMGFGVEEQGQIFTALAEQALVRAGYDAEVLNFGVGGYNTWQEVALLRHRGLQFNPDVVVLQYCLNDDHDPWPANKFIVSEILNRNGSRNLIPAHLLSPLVARSALIRFLWARTAHWWAPQADVAREYAHLTENRVSQALAALQALSVEHGFRVVVLVFPAKWLAKSPDDNREMAWVGREAERFGFHSRQLLPVLQQCADKGAPFIDWWHLTPRGHACVAEALTATLEEAFGPPNVAR